MKKERLAAFFDATLAIIMTILVLELKAPKEAAWAALWSMRIHFFSYALSFFWLGSMWIRMHNEWYQAEWIDTSCLWLSIVLLFFSSLVPFATSFLDSHLESMTAELFYLGLMIIISVVNLLLERSLLKANPDNLMLEDLYGRRRRRRWINLGIKIAGFVVTLFIPQAGVVAVLVSLIYIIV
jgi:uncharacterized membrane protein